ncbi:conserved Plasmodium protein, unknown function [Plasmodium relictum]|uniref:Uncharacterized protein n=1 Tax=Plasmodium relictum TaxID=85471 RepID=A0A1J1HAM1_PLARL|nr:conserved Plasmodium protein, unknown function [Plasmodium relictum]CRH02476.1 conserved Plasmodium protein, unknown function [Plasmodium relictum]
MNSFSSKTNIRSTKSEVIKKPRDNLIENEKENNFSNSSYLLQKKNLNINCDLGKSELNNCNNTYNGQFLYSNQNYNDASSTRNIYNKIKLPRSQSINISPPISIKTSNLYRNNDDKLSCASFYTSKKKNLEKFSIPESTDSFKTQANSQIVEQSIELLKHLINQDKDDISQENDTKDKLLFKLVDRMKKYDNKSEHTQEEYKHSLDLYKKKIDMLNLKFLKLRNENNHLNNENIILKTQLKNIKGSYNSINHNIGNISNSRERIKKEVLENKNQEMKPDEIEEMISNKSANNNSQVTTSHYSKKKLVDNEVQTESYLANHSNSLDAYRGTSFITNKENILNENLLDGNNINKIREQIKKEVTEEITNKLEKKYKEELLKMRKSPSFGSISDTEESSLDSIFNKFRNQLDEQINETINNYKNNFIDNFKDLLNITKGKENNAHELDKDGEINKNEINFSIDSTNDKINDCINVIEKITKIKKDKKKKEEKIINDRKNLIQVLNNVNKDINNIDDMIYNINANIYQNNFFNFEENYPEELSIINKNISESDDEEDEIKSHKSFTNIINNNDEYTNENKNNINSNIDFYQNDELKYNKANYITNRERKLDNSLTNYKIESVIDGTVNDNYIQENNIKSDEKCYDNVINKNINNNDYFITPQKSLDENKGNIIDNTYKKIEDYNKNKIHNNKKTKGVSSSLSDNNLNINNNKKKKNSNESLNGNLTKSIENVENVIDRTKNKLKNNISDKKLKKKNLSDNFSNNIELWKKNDNDNLNENEVDFYNMINSPSSVRIEKSNMNVITNNISNENKNNYINFNPNIVSNENNVYGVNQSAHIPKDDKMEEFQPNAYNNDGNNHIFNVNVDGLSYQLNKNSLNNANINNNINNCNNICSKDYNFNNYYNDKDNMKCENSEYDNGNYYNNETRNIVDDNNCNAVDNSDLYNYNLTNDHNLCNFENNVCNKNTEKNLVNCSIYSYHPLLNKKDNVHYTNKNNEKKKSEHENPYMKAMNEQIHPNNNSRFRENDDIKKKGKSFNNEKENNVKYPFKKFESTEELIHFDDTQINDSLKQKEKNQNITNKETNNSFTYDNDNNNNNNNINTTHEISKLKRNDKNYDDIDYLNKIVENNNNECNLNNFELDENVRLNNYKNYGFLKKKDSYNSREDETTNNKYNLFYDFNNENNKNDYIKEYSNLQIDDSSNNILSNYYNKNSNLRRVNSTTINTNKNNTNDVCQKNKIKLNTRSEVHYNLSKSQKTKTKKNLEDLFS